MLKGIGVDITRIRRYNNVKSKDRFLKQFLNDEEISKANRTNNKNRYPMTLFAIKEAIFKAFKIGLYFGSYWHDISIKKDFKVNLSGYFRKMIRSRTRILVSKTCSKQYALSLALIEE